jgi:hypothetical protein
MKMKAKTIDINNDVEKSQQRNDAISDDGKNANGDHSDSKNRTSIRKGNNDDDNDNDDDDEEKDMSVDLNLIEEAESNARKVVMEQIAPIPRVGYEPGNKSIKDLYSSEMNYRENISHDVIEFFDLLTRIKEQDDDYELSYMEVIYIKGLCRFYEVKVQRINKLLELLSTKVLDIYSSVKFTSDALIELEHSKEALPKRIEFHNIQIDLSRLYETMKKEQSDLRKQLKDSMKTIYHYNEKSEWKQSGYVLKMVNVLRLYDERFDEE